MAPLTPPARLVSAPDPLDAPNTTYLWAQLFVEELVRTGVTLFFVAPGSRSTPLTVAAARHPEAEVVLHVDERGTSFAALGAARATGGPAAWITTSGTAVANGHPAVVEADVDGVPMLLLTADRPPELRATGANQTVDQVKLFGDHVRDFVDVPPPSADVDPAYVLTTVDQAVHRARRAPPGPVHLNCGFRKPLEPTQGPLPSVPDPVADWAAADTPYTRYPTPVLQPSGADVEALAATVGAAARGVVVAGRLDRAADVQAARRLARALNWPLLPDLTSRLRFGARADVDVPFADLVLTADAFRAAAAPDAVLQVGGRFASKRLRLFLRDHAPAPRAVIRPSPGRVDPDHRVTHHVEAHLAPVVESLLARTDAAGPDAWRERWTAASRRAKTVVERHADTTPLTEPAVAHHLSRLVPPEHAVVAASSMPVRDLNRHAGTEGPATLLIGDLALWHDLNSLALVAEQPVVVIVINNDGGGIFHFLPIREHDDVFEPYFTTPQGRSFEGAAATFGLSYHSPTTPDAFRSAYETACTGAGAALIEVQTDRAENRRVHEALEAAVAAAVTDGL